MEMGCNRNLPWSEEFYYTYEKYWVWLEDENVDFPAWINDNPNLPWSADFLERHKHKINWEMISQQDEGELFPWSAELLERFSEYWDWELLSDNKSLPWSGELIEKFRNYWDWKNLSRNENLPWSEKLIRKFHNLWDWDGLAENKAINWSGKMITLYQDRLKVDNLIWLKNGRPDRTLYWRYDPYDLLDPRNEKDRQFTRQEMDHILANPDWRKMSFNEHIPWSIGLLEYYQDHWHWDLLSNNISLPWSEALIDKFIDRWEWGKEIDQGDGTAILIQGLSFNPALPWSIEFLDRYKERWFWHDIGYNMAMPWSLELIERFHDYWAWIDITHITDLWTIVFADYLDPEGVDFVMGEIVKNNAGTDHVPATKEQTR